MQPLNFPTYGLSVKVSANTANEEASDPAKGRARCLHTHRAIQNLICSKVHSAFEDRRNSELTVRKKQFTKKDDMGTAPDIVTRPSSGVQEWQSELIETTVLSSSSSSQVEELLASASSSNEDNDNYNVNLISPNNNFGFAEFSTMGTAIADDRFLTTSDIQTSSSIFYAASPIERTKRCAATAEMTNASNRSTRIKSDQTTKEDSSIEFIYSLFKNDVVSLRPEHNIA